jgi:hypothetical protein
MCFCCSVVSDIIYFDYTLHWIPNEQIRTKNEAAQTKEHSSWSNYGTEQPQQGEQSGRCKDSRKPERNKGTTATTEASSQNCA